LYFPLAGCRVARTSCNNFAVHIPRRDRIPDNPADDSATKIPEPICGLLSLCRSVSKRPCHLWRVCCKQFGASEVFQCRPGTCGKIPRHAVPDDNNNGALQSPIARTPGSPCAL